MRKSTEGNVEVIETPTPILLVNLVPHSDPRANSSRFDESKKSEVEGLQRRQVWTVVSGDTLPADANIIGVRFNLTLKNYGTEREKVKARFMGQGYKDDMKDFIVHSTPTLRQSSTRIILSAAAVLNYLISMIDFVQAYLQSKEKLSRRIYLKIREKDRQYFGLRTGQLLELQKPLYGICDSGDYWGPHSRATSGRN